MGNDLTKLRKSVANIKKVLTKEPVKPLSKKEAVPLKGKS